MTEKADFDCPFDCSFIELEDRVRRDGLTLRSYSEIKELCDEKRLQITREYGVDVPCGIAGELIVRKVLQEPM